MLAGKVRIAEWKEGREPLLQVDKRGRFITNMGFANVVTAAVESDDPRLKGSCMVILEEGDPGVWDRGTPTKKLVHQLSSTNDPVFNLQVPASRIVGGYTIQGRRHHPELLAQRNHRSRFPPHACDRRLDDFGEAAFRHRAGDSLSPPALSRRPGRARHAALRTGHPAKAGRPAPPGGHLGHGRGQRLAGLRGGAALRPTRPAGKGKGPHPRRKEIVRPRRVQGADARRKPEALDLLDAQISRSNGPLVQIRPVGLAGQRALPRVQALEYRPRREHDARSRQPHGRLRPDGGLPRFSRPEMDGRATGSHLRRPGGGAAIAAFHHHDQPSCSWPSSSNGLPK